MRFRYLILLFAFITAAAGVQLLVWEHVTSRRGNVSMQRTLENVRLWRAIFTDYCVDAGRIEAGTDGLFKWLKSHEDEYHRGDKDIYNDGFGTPLRFHMEGMDEYGTTLLISSAGPDRKFDTDDDRRWECPYDPKALKKAVEAAAAREDGGE